MFILYILLGLVLGGVLGYFYQKTSFEKENSSLAEKSDKILSEAKNKAKELVYDAKSEALKIRDSLKNEEKKKQKEIAEIEQRLMKKENNLDKKNEEIDKTRNKIDEKLETINKEKEELSKKLSEQARKLEEIAKMSKEEAKTYLLDQVEEEVKDDIVAQIKKAEKDLQDKVDEKAKWILADAISRCASEVTVESTSTVVNLPSDDMKGRIIGKEGRNINTFEHITGVDVIVDDTPGSILVSGFDLVRRYIAKVTLERLIEDGRIHPARIEEMYYKVKSEVNDLIKELGEKAMIETGVTGFHPNLVKILGRLKFRVVNGQNALKHAIEVSHLAANLASDLGADVNVAKKAGLLHSIGKAVDHEVPGDHAKISADIAKKFGMSDAVVEAIQSYVDQNNDSLPGLIVRVASMVSAARPGAKKDNLDNFINRLSELENLCKEFKGVDKAYAVKAGSEVRIFVSPEELDDLASVKLSYEIARKIEREQMHSGPVKVHVIRELRDAEYAK